jgi:hypothetical protein
MIFSLFIKIFIKNKKIITQENILKNKVFENSKLEFTIKKSRLFIHKT